MNSPKPKQAIVEYKLTLRLWAMSASTDAHWYENEIQRVARMIQEGYLAGEIIGERGERGWWDFEEVTPSTESASKKLETSK